MFDLKRGKMFLILKYGISKYIIEIKEDIRGRKIWYYKFDEKNIEDVTKAINSCKNTCSELMYKQYNIFQEDIINVFLFSENISEKMKNKIKLYFNIGDD